MTPPDFRVVLRDPRFKVEFEIHQKGHDTIRYVSEEVPVDKVDIFRNIIGDGRARVSVTVDVGIKDFGTGVSASCTVVLTCNQDVATIEQASRLAGETARSYAHEHRALGENELNQVLASRPQIPR